MTCADGLRKTIAEQQDLPTQSTAPRIAFQRRPADHRLSAHEVPMGAAVAIRTPRQLAMRLRQNSVDCQEIATNHPQPEHRAQLLRTAEHYRRLADKIDEPTARWEAFMKTLGTLLRRSRTKSTPQPLCAALPWPAAERCEPAELHNSSGRAGPPSGTSSGSMARAWMPTHALSAEEGDWHAHIIDRR